MAALKQQLQQKLQQKLSPQQIQLIRLLELTEIEFEERVQQELVDNPALEEGREEIPDSINEFDANADEDGNPGESAEELTLGDYRNEEDIPDYRLEADNYSKDDKKEDIPFVSASSFHDYLESQLGELSLDETSYQIAQYIIGNIDDNGYLQRPIQAISDDLIFQVGLDVPASQVEDILQMIQEFEPAGVGASNLRECLLLQLERHEGTPANLLAYKIIDKMFEEFSKKHYDKIMRQCNVCEEELKQAIREITLLNPKPGSAWNNSYSGSSEHHIIPDFFVEAQDGELTIGLNNGNIPELHVSRDYQDMFDDYSSNKQNQTREKRDALLFVKQKLDAAQWFVTKQAPQHNLPSAVGAKVLDQPVQGQPLALMVRKQLRGLWVRGVEQEIGPAHPEGILPPGLPVQLQLFLCGLQPLAGPVGEGVQPEAGAGEAPVLENGPGAQAGRKQALAGLLLQPALQPGDIVQRDGDDFSDH